MKIPKLNNMAAKDKIIYINVLGAFAVKGASLLVSLFTMPAYMRFFTDQQILGVWFTMLSVLTWILNFDLGVGNGLRNKLVEALTSNDRNAAREYISSAYFLIGLLMLLLLGVGYYAIPYCQWHSFFNISGNTISDNVLISAVRNVYISILLQFFLRLVTAILYALQKSSVNNFITLIISLLQLIFALIAPTRSSEESLSLFSVAYIFCANVPLAVATVVVFVTSLKDIRPSWRFVRKDRAQQVLSLGGVFFICQLLYMFITATDEFFISRYTGPANVVEYQIYNKVFSLFSTIFLLAITPIWSAVSKAAAENDYLWMKKLNKNLLKMSALIAILEFLMLPFSQLLINIWLGSQAIQVNYWYAACFAFYGSMMVLQSSVSTIGNGLGMLNIQAICYAIGLAFKFLIIHFGIASTGLWIMVTLANGMILIPYCIAQEISIKRLIKRKLTNNTSS